MVSLIAAVSDNGIIGVDNKMPWYIPDDLKRFKRLTTDNVVIMGRKTYESIGQPLPNRLNIVISRNKDLVIEGCLVVDSITKAIKKAGNNRDIFIIGGGEIYKRAIDFADRIYLTKIHIEVEGDTTFPTIDTINWVEKGNIKNEGFSYITYDHVLLKN
jgi:dihydrofolate reductase